MYDPLEISSPNHTSSGPQADQTISMFMMNSAEIQLNTKCQTAYYFFFYLGYLIQFSKRCCYFIPSSESSAYLKQIKCILSAVKKYRIFSLVTDAGPRSAIGRAPDWYVRGPGFNTRSGNILSFLLPLFQEGQLSVTGESMCTKYWLTA